MHRPGGPALPVGSFSRSGVGRLLYALGRRVSSTLFRSPKAAALRVWLAPVPSLLTAGRRCRLRPCRSPEERTRNVMSVDVEDWFCVHNLSRLIPYAEWDKCESRVERSTGLLL